MRTKAEIKDKGDIVEVVILARSESRLKWLKRVFNKKPVKIIVESK